ncbi:MAG: beta-alanine-activating enzyme beta-propeller domain-containing protein [Candidatus Odinarchaeia archaeon]
MIRKRYFAIFLLVLFSASFLLLGSAQATDWPKFRYDPANTGYINTNSPLRLSKLWSYETTDIVESSPAIVDGKLYIGTFDGRLLCLSPDNGSLIWNYTVLSITSYPVISSPAVYSGYVYFGAYDWYIYCLSAATGSLQWRYPTSGVVMSSPAVNGSNVFIGSNDGYIYSVSNGALNWRYSTGDEVRSSPALADNKVYVGSYSDYIYCLDQSTGALIWSYKTGGNIDSSPTVIDGRVYVGSQDGNVYCLNASDGSSIWTYTTLDMIRFSSPAVVDGRVFIGSMDKNIYCLNATTGTKIWNYTTGGAVASSPAVADGKVYFGSVDNKVYCFNSSSGELIDAYTTDGAVSSSPTIVDGRVYIGSDDGGIYCLEDDNIPPTVSITSPANHSVYWVYSEDGNTTIQITWSASDNHAVIYYEIYLNGVYNGNTTSTSTFVTLSPNRYNITIVAYDYVGNGGSEHIELTVSYELPLQVFIISPSNGSQILSDSPQYNVTVSWITVNKFTISKYSVYVNNNLHTNTTATTVQLTLQYGEHNITIIAYDNAENTASSSITVTIQSSSSGLSQIPLETIILMSFTGLAIALSIASIILIIRRTGI